MNKEDHKRAIEDLAELQKRKKAIAEKVISRLDFRAIIAGDAGKRTVMRNLFLVTFLKESDALFSEVSRLGKSFAELKLGN